MGLWYTLKGSHTNSFFAVLGNRKYLVLQVVVLLLIIPCTENQFSVLIRIFYPTEPKKYGLTGRAWCSCDFAKEYLMSLQGCRSQSAVLPSHPLPSKTCLACEDEVFNEQLQVPPAESLNLVT